MFTKSTVSQALIDATKAILEESEKKMLLEPELDETGFHKAAHAAKKASQSHFEFQGKKYPVTAKSQSEGMIPVEKIQGQISKKKDDKAAATGLSADVRESNQKFDPLKHVKNPTKGEKDAAKDVKRGSYADRAAMLRSAQADGRLKEEHDDEVEDKALVKKLVKKSALKMTNEDGDCVTPPQAKKIADKEVGKHVKKMHEEDGLEEGWEDMMQAARDRAKPQPNGGSGVKLGSRYGGGKQKEEPKEKELKERSLTPTETKTKEHNVKSMKKNLAGFKSRYGDRAKSVMYATATKQAKNEDLGGISTMSEEEDVRIEPNESLKTKTVDTLAGRVKVGADYHNKPKSYKIKLNVEDTVAEGKGTDVNPVFVTNGSTPMGLAKELAKKSFSKIRKETLGMAGHTSEEKKHGE